MKISRLHVVQGRYILGTYRVYSAKLPTTCTVRIPSHEAWGNPLPMGHREACSGATFLGIATPGEQPGYFSVTLQWVGERWVWGKACYPAPGVPNHTLECVGGMILGWVVCVCVFRGGEGIVSIVPRVLEMYCTVCTLWFE